MNQWACLLSTAGRNAAPLLHLISRNEVVEFSRSKPKTAPDHRVDGVFDELVVLLF